MRIGGRELFDSLCNTIGTDYTVKLYREFQGQQLYIADISNLIYTEKEAKVYEEFKKLSEYYSEQVIHEKLSRKFDLTNEVVVRAIHIMRRLERRGWSIDKGRPQSGLHEGEYGGKGLSNYISMCRVIGVEDAIALHNKYRGKTLYFLMLKNALKNERNKTICEEFNRLKKVKNKTEHDLHVYLQRKYRISWMRIREIVNNEKTNINQAC